MSPTVVHGMHIQFPLRNDCHVLVITVGTLLRYGSNRHGVALNSNRESLVRSQNGAPGVLQLCDRKPLTRIILPLKTYLFCLKQSSEGGGFHSQQVAM